jgi:hypothetical protein
LPEILMAAPIILFVIRRIQEIRQLRSNRQH